MIWKKTISVAIVICLLLCIFVACGGNTTTTTTPPTAWDSATYKADTTLGTGAKTICVSVTAYERTITFTIHTDAQTLGQALVAHSLIVGEQGQYGLFVTSVNGIPLANQNKEYWALYIGTEYAMTGVDSTPLSGGEQFALVYESFA